MQDAEYPDPVAHANKLIAVAPLFELASAEQQQVAISFLNWLVAATTDQQVAIKKFFTRLTPEGDENYQLTRAEIHELMGMKSRSEKLDEAGMSIVRWTFDNCDDIDDDE